ncbi:MAG: 3D domain-containing protein [Gemmatimonadaceae bacterium]
MKRWEVIRAILAVLVAAGLIQSGFARLPSSQPEPFRYAPVVVYPDLVLPPLIVRAERVLPELRRLPVLAKLPTLRNVFARAPVGQPLEVSLTQYCLQGTTRRDHYVREGIVAADPRVFPLARYVEIFLGKHYLGRYLVDDTGGKVKGRTLDIWNPSCSEARRFGRQRGTATLIVKSEN